MCLEGKHGPLLISCVLEATMCTFFSVNNQDNGDHFVAFMDFWLKVLAAVKSVLIFKSRRTFYTFPI